MRPASNAGDMVVTWEVSKMDYEQLQFIADMHGLGSIHFQFNTAQNTGNKFEVGYISRAGKRELFCKRQSNSNCDQFYLCNEFREMDIK